MNENLKIKKIATLAMLLSKDGQTEREFEKMLAFLEIPESKTTDLQRVVTEANVREDIPCRCMDKKILCSLAPETDDNYITLPRALEEQKK